MLHSVGTSTLSLTLSLFLTLSLMWQELKNRLQASFKFNDFNEAIAFMNEVAVHADKLDHHPTWTNTYNMVEIQLATHEAGNIVTEKDRQLAEIIDKVYQKYSLHD